MIPTNENYFTIFLNKYPSSAACLLEKWDPHPAKECATKEVTKYQLNVGSTKVLPRFAILE